MRFRSLVAAWLSRLRRPRPSRPAPQGRHSFRPSVEALEDRCVPSTLGVSSNPTNGAAGTLPPAAPAVTQVQSGATIPIATSVAKSLSQVFQLFPPDPIAPSPVNSLPQLFPPDATGGYTAGGSVAENALSLLFPPDPARGCITSGGVAGNMRLFTPPDPC
jgi:hypothetical protein